MNVIDKDALQRAFETARRDPTHAVASMRGSPQAEAGKRSRDPAPVTAKVSRSILRRGSGSGRFTTPTVSTPCCASLSVILPAVVKLARCRKNWPRLVQQV